MIARRVLACQALRTLRPLRRRAAMTARPPGVAMRARKPCVLARLRLFGWKVRLLMLFTHPLKGGLHVFGCAGWAQSRTIVSSSSMECQRSTPRLRLSDGARRSIHVEQLLIVGSLGFPVSADELLQNLWIVWKTQDSCGPRLWITSMARLLSRAPSARIGQAVWTLQTALGTLKTPAQMAWP
jgi:hypothetical protein